MGIIYDMWFQNKYLGVMDLLEIWIDGPVSLRIRSMRRQELVQLDLLLIRQPLLDVYQQARTEGLEEKLIRFVTGTRLNRYHEKKWG